MRFIKYKVNFAARDKLVLCLANATKKVIILYKSSLGIGEYHQLQVISQEMQMTFMDQSEQWSRLFMLVVFFYVELTAFIVQVFKR